MRLKSKASYTVEATFVMSIIIFVIFALMYLTFYLYDKSKIQNILDISAVKISEMLKQEGDIELGTVDYDNINEQSMIRWVTNNYEREESIGAKYIKKELNKKLIISSMETLQVDIHRTKVKISAKVNMDIPLLGARRYFTKEKLSIQLGSTVSIHHPAEFLRLASSVLDTASSIKGADKVASKLQDLLNLLLGLKE